MTVAHDNKPALAPIGRVDTVKVADFCYISKLPRDVSSEICMGICGLETADELAALIRRIDRHVHQLMQIRKRLIGLKKFGGEAPDLISNLEQAYYIFECYKALARRCLLGDKAASD